MQTEHTDEPHELPQRQLEDEDFAHESEGEEQGDEDLDEGDNARAGQQLGAFEPIETPQPPSSEPLKLPEHKIEEAKDVPERSLAKDFQGLLESTLSGSTATASDFASTFTGEMMPLRPLARSTWEAVEKLGRVKPTLGQRMAFGHNRNYQAFTGYAKRQTDKSRNERLKEAGKSPTSGEGAKKSGGFSPIIGIGSIFWGDYGRYKRHQRNIKKGRAEQGSTTDELKPGEATALEYRRSLEQRIKPLIQPLLNGMRSVAASMQVTLPGDYEGRLLTYLAPQIAHKSSQEILKWL